MSTCKHRIKPTAVEILTLQSAFLCEVCDEYVEPIKPWRIVRALVSAISLIAILYAAFSKLQGTLEALALMIGIIALALIIFFTVNFLVLTKTPLTLARADVNPDLMGLYEDDDSGDGLEEDIESEEPAAGPDPVDHLDRWIKKP